MKWVGPVKWASKSRGRHDFYQCQEKQSLAGFQQGDPQISRFFFVKVLVAVITTENWNHHNYNSLIATGHGQGAFLSKLIDGLFNNGILRRLWPILFETYIYIIPCFIKITFCLKAENCISEENERRKQERKHTHTLYSLGKRLKIALKRGETLMFESCVLLSTKW